MASLGPSEFRKQQERYAQDMANLRAFVELTRKPADETVPPAAARAPDEADLTWQRDRIARAIDGNRRLEPHIQRSWSAALGEIDLVDAGAPAALDDLDGRVGLYMHGFPWHVGFSGYTEASMLHEELAELVSLLGELEEACKAYLAARDR
jgi:hypothetical protein